MLPKIVTTLRRASLPSFTLSEIEWLKNDKKLENTKILNCYSKIPPIFYKSRAIIYSLTDELPTNVQFTTYSINMQKLELNSELKKSTTGSLIHNLAVIKIKKIKLKFKNLI
jgi:hypothetical protein